jgi:tetratricopeptide (TPR) repeat protein
MGVQPGLVYYFYGEMYRQRGGEGDLDLAIESYYHSIKAGNAPAESYKNLGYLYLKIGETTAAQREFKTYLELEPNGSDRAMIEFYLEE